MKIKRNSEIVKKRGGEESKMAAKEGGSWPCSAGRREIQKSKKNSSPRSCREQRETIKIIDKISQHQGGEKKRDG